MRQHRRKRGLRIAGLTAIAVVAFVFIVGLFAPSLPISIGSSRGGDAGEEVPGVRGGDGNLHVELGEAPQDPYTSVPATSGWHYSVAGISPARWGVHEEAVPDEVLVHNLEHGGVGIHYDCPDGCDELVATLEEITERYSSSSDPRTRKVIMSPYPGMDTRIALTAWTYIDRLEEVSEARIVEFITDHVSSSVAPESRAR